MRPTWNSIYMDLAKSIARRSTCNRLQVGCVITSRNNERVLAIGYNGGPKGLHNECISNEPGKCGHLHAEINALIKLDSTNPTPKVLYVTDLPCYSCAVAIVNAGISKVVYDRDYRMKDGLELLRQAGIDVLHYNESFDTLAEIIKNDVTYVPEDMELVPMCKVCRVKPCKGSDDHCHAEECIPFQRFHMTIDLFNEIRTPGVYVDMSLKEKLAGSCLNRDFVRGQFEDGVYSGVSMDIGDVHNQCWLHFYDQSRRRISMNDYKFILDMVEEYKRGKPKRFDVAAFERLWDEGDITACNKDLGKYVNPVRTVTSRKWGILEVTEEVFQAVMKRFHYNTPFKHINIRDWFIFEDKSPCQKVDELHFWCVAELQIQRILNPDVLCKKIDGPKA